jgi:general stress protein YciG
MCVAARVFASTGVRALPGARISNPGVEGTLAKEDRGFASMDRGKQREIASKGGKAAHQKGTAHEWTSEEAREAGRKGGMASHRRKQEQSSSSPMEAQGQSREEIAANGSESESMMGRGDELP